MKTQKSTIKTQRQLVKQVYDEAKTWFNKKFASVDPSCRMYQKKIKVSGTKNKEDDYPDLGAISFTCTWKKNHTWTQPYGTVENYKNFYGNLINHLESKFPSLHFKHDIDGDYGYQREDINISLQPFIDAINNSDSEEDVDEEE